MYYILAGTCDSVHRVAIKRQPKLLLSRNIVVDVSCTAPFFSAITMNPFYDTFVRIALVISSFRLAISACLVDSRSFLTNPIRSRINNGHPESGRLAREMLTSNLTRLWSRKNKRPLGQPAR